MTRLKQEHIAYVDAHGQRLEQRLQENRQHRQQITSEMQALEDDLLRLLEENLEELADLPNLK